jgi:hypothetical protein
LPASSGGYPVVNCLFTFGFSMPKEIATRTERILVKPRHENHRACKALCSLRQAFFSTGRSAFQRQK